MCGGEKIHQRLSTNLGNLNLTFIYALFCTPLQLLPIDIPYMGILGVLIMIRCIKGPYLSVHILIVLIYRHPGSMKGIPLLHYNNKEHQPIFQNHRPCRGIAMK